MDDAKITLFAARKNIGLTQVEAAKQLGVSKSTLQNWESAKTFPNQPEIERLCKLYNLRYERINFCPSN